jgi:hypothetical protein
MAFLVALITGSDSWLRGDLLTFLHGLASNLFSCSSDFCLWNSWDYIGVNAWSDFQLLFFILCFIYLCFFILDKNSLGLSISLLNFSRNIFWLWLFSLILFLVNLFALYALGLCYLHYLLLFISFYNIWNNIILYDIKSYIKIAVLSIFYGSRIWTQGVMLARQSLLLLEPLCQPFCAFLFPEFLSFKFRSLNLDIIPFK